VVLRAAEALAALARGGGALVDVLGDRRGTDESDGANHLGIEDRVDGFLVAVHDAEDACGQAGFEAELGNAHGHGGVALGGLQDERVACCDRRAELPERDHRREVEGRDAGDDAERLTHRVDVDAGAGAVGELALEEVRDAAGEFDDFDAALDIALGVLDGLAVLAGEQDGELVLVGVEQLNEAGEHAGALLRVRRAPGGLRGFGLRDGVVDLGFAREAHLRLHFAGAGVVHVGEAAGRRLDPLAIDEVRDHGGEG
jgi:hypothetical protein